MGRRSLLLAGAGLIGVLAAGCGGAGPDPTPSPVSTPTVPVSFYLVLPGDNGQNGSPAGCGSSVVAVSGDQGVTGRVQDDVRSSLEELLATAPHEFDADGYVHALDASPGLTVVAVDVTQGQATILIDGTFVPVDACTGALQESQLLYTIFQYSGVNSALISIGTRNLRAVLHAGARPDDPYTRGDFEALKTGPAG